jgi:dTDP-3-amino-3,4,6-trideoxy-alpha-D-glucose transaminase
MNTPPVLANDFAAQWESIRADAAAALERVGNSGWLILGREVTDFEVALGPLFGKQHAIGTGNGLDALEIALRVAGLKPGQKVLTTPLSAFATTLAIVRAGGAPVFVDVDQSGLLDLDKASARLAKGDIAFLLPVHLFGHAQDLARLKALSVQFGTPLIEDCAQSIIAKSRGALTGSAGLLAATSFYPTKNLGCLGDGGAVLTSDDGLATQARALRDYGQSAKYLHEKLGLNSRLDELQAAFLRSALLPKLEQWTTRRRQIAATYRAGLKSPALTIPMVPEGSESAWHLFPVLVEGDRDAFMKRLKDRGIQSGVHYPVLIPHQVALREVAHEVAGPLDQAARFARAEVSIPVHPFMTDEAVGRVIEACNDWQR